MITAELAFQVSGTPAPQGSKKGIHHRSTGRIIVFEQQNARVRTWRDNVKAAAARAMQVETGDTWEQFTGPIHVMVIFQLQRPANHYGTGRNAKILKATAPRYPARMPDLDKLERATYDAITGAGVWLDDGQIVMAEISKLWSTTGTAGAFIRITDLDRLQDIPHRKPIEAVDVTGGLL